MPKERIVLTDDDFKRLISGQELETRESLIILQDIGYERMIQLISILKDEAGI